MVSLSSYLDMSKKDSLRIIPSKPQTIEDCCTVKAETHEGGCCGYGVVISFSMNSIEARELGERLIRFADKAEK